MLLSIRQCRGYGTLLTVLMAVASHAQTPAVPPVPSVTPTTVSTASSVSREQAYLAFRKAMTEAVAFADQGKLPQATTSLRAAVAANASHFDLPKLSTTLNDDEKSVPPALLKEDALKQGMPYWVLEAMVRLGDVEGAKAAAHGQTDPQNRYRALSLVAVAQAARYLNTPYQLPAVVAEKPEEWVAKTDAPGSKPGMVRALKVTSLTGPVLAPPVDCRALEKRGAADNAGAFATLHEAMEALGPTRDVWLYRELAEIQGKMGDQPGALQSVQQARDIVVTEWEKTHNDKTLRDVTRQKMSLLVADLEALGDKTSAEKLKKLIAANAFQQVGLPLFITINIGALLIGFAMWRANRTRMASEAGRQAMTAE